MENAPHIPKNMLPIPPVTTLGNSAAKLPVNAIHFSPILAELARLEKSEVFTRMKTSPEGLSEADAKRRLAEAGPNVIASEKHRGWLWRLLTATRNPLVILLIAGHRGRRRTPAFGGIEMLFQMARNVFRHLEHGNLLLASKDGFEDIVSIDQRLFLCVLKFVLLDVIPYLFGHFATWKRLRSYDPG